MTDQTAERLLANNSAFMTKIIEMYTHDFSGTAESPIEKLFGAAATLSIETIYRGFDYEIGGGITFDEAEKRLNKNKGKDGILFSQVMIDQFRVDFLLLHRSGVAGNAGFVIECDGHEFHEKTKEQAARDKARDRSISSRSLQIMRFTGSEIWRDPFGCVFQVFSVAEINTEVARSLRYYISTGDLNQFREMTDFINGQSAPF